MFQLVKLFFRDIVQLVCVCVYEYVCVCIRVCVCTGGRIMQQLSPCADDGCLSVHERFSGTEQFVVAYLGEANGLTCGIHVCIHPHPQCYSPPPRHPPHKHFISPPSHQNSISMFLHVFLFILIRLKSVSARKKEIHPTKTVQQTKTEKIVHKCLLMLSNFSDRNPYDEK